DAATITSTEPPPEQPPVREDVCFTLRRLRLQRLPLPFDNDNEVEKEAAFGQQRLRKGAGLANDADEDSIGVCVFVSQTIPQIPFQLYFNEDAFASARRSIKFA
ncbi:hypothetical protein FRB97_003546, partial [Tulasnella sp. 331]